GYLTGPGVDAARVRAELAQLLPAYMIPASWLVLDALPLTANGKLDRKALPRPALSGQEAKRAAGDNRERVLAEIFADVLGIGEVGVDEDFFALGGDSIRSIQLVSRARAAGLALTTRDVFERRTVADLARAATETPAEDSPAPEPADALITLSAEELADLELELSEDLT
ncbi:phosphopantetheine-binding protein, partial [Streptomyces sp. NPDC001356]